jgi:hypothetical protein
MSSAIGEARSYPAYGQTLVGPRKISHIERTERTQYVRPQVGTFAWLARAIGSILYTLAMLSLTIAVTAVAIVVVPWLPLLPAVLLGLVVRLAGVVLGGLGLL